MTRPLQDLAITNTITDLEWCTRPPHTLEDIVARSWNRFPRTRWDHGTSNAQMAADIRAEAEAEGGGRIPDPTGEAVASGAVYAMTRYSDTEPTTTTSGDSGDDATPSAIDSAIDLLYYSADELIMLCLDGERITQAGGTVAKLDAAITVLRRVQPLVIQARDLMDRQGRNHLDLLVYQHLSETAEWLRSKGEALCSGSKKAAQPQRPGEQPKGCVSCARDRDGAGRPYFEGIDERNHASREMCRTCGDYYSGNGVMLPLGAVEYMHRTGKKVTWKIIEDARRAERAS